MQRKILQKGLILHTTNRETERLIILYLITCNNVIYMQWLIKKKINDFIPLNMQTHSIIVSIVFPQKLKILHMNEHCINFILYKRRF